MVPEHVPYTDFWSRSFVRFDRGRLERRESAKAEEARSPASPPSVIRETISMLEGDQLRVTKGDSDAADDDETWS